MSFTTTATADGELYRYRELSGQNIFRVLRLDALDTDAGPLLGPIVGKLRCVSLDDYKDDETVTNYNAMSYCWGDPTPVDRIWLSETEYLPISASAAYILRNFKRDIDIWIDSVCINQSDSIDKAGQVTMMWDIFKRAECVVVWLGDLRDDADLAMNLVFNIVNRFEIPFGSQRRPVFLHKGYPTEADNYHEPSWSALSKLLDRPWFRRVWIIQEVVAARKVAVTCGRYYLWWQNLVELLRLLDLWNCHRLIQLRDPANPLQREYLPCGFDSIRRIQSLRKFEDSAVQKASLEWCLSITINTEAQDPRDKIFSILSFSDAMLVPELQPDYNASVRDVYTSATRYSMTHTQSLSLLHLAGVGWNRTHAELPSWVPDYFRVRSDVYSGKSSHLHANPLHRMLRFAESGLGYYTQTPEIKTFKFAPRAISIRGFVEDTVVLVCPGLSLEKRLWKRITSESYSERMSTVKWFNHSFKSVNTVSKSSYSPSNHRNQRPPNSSDAFWHALTMSLTERDMDDLFLGAAGSRKYSDAFMAFLLYSVATKDGKPNLDRFTRERLELAATYTAMLEQVQDWSVFVTSKGRFGRGPPLMQKGDRVCIFAGAKTPFIVRRAYPTWISRLLPGCIHELVGECFVEGLIRSEAVIERERPYKPIGSPLFFI